MKIQTVYSFKSKQIETFEFEDETTNDNSYMKTLADKISTNELLLVDLGYFDKKCFKMIDFLKKSCGVIYAYLYVGMKQNNREEFRVIDKRLPEEVVNLRI
ncbi:hypothetical protein BCD95_000886 [Clostridium beijerinckii]|uniref:Transposase IS4-like domain-containing protein n=1 Tax=Clostridium beijerinckii TaxID=1520 RepID=A0AAE5LNJ5_CLOBE|nr:hypothetical protein [Clostridium beijerinckii]OOM29192.1 hypothetical protein CLOBE_23230 [Clostridium beijerinckii]